MNESKIPLFRGFQEPCCQNVEQWLSCSQLPQEVDVTIRQKSLFKAAKMSIWFSAETIHFSTNILMTREESHFKSPKERTVLWMLDTSWSRVWGYLSNRIFRMPNDINVWTQVTKTRQNGILRASKCPKKGPQVVT